MSRRGIAPQLPAWARPGGASSARQSTCSTHDRHLHRRRCLPGTRGSLSRRDPRRPAGLRRVQRLAPDPSAGICPMSAWSSSTPHRTQPTTGSPSGSPPPMSASPPISRWPRAASPRARAPSRRPAGIGRRTISAMLWPAARSRSHMREIGMNTGGPAALTRADRSRFLSALDAAVQAALQVRQPRTSRPASHPTAGCRR